MRKVAMKYLLAAALTILTLTSSMAMVVTMTRISNQMKIHGIDKIEMKGMGALQIVVDIENNSKYDITMSDATADLKVNGKRIGRLSQVDPATSRSMERTQITSLWRLEEVDPMSLLFLSGKILQSDFSGITMDYKSVVSAGKYSHNFSDTEVDISKFLTIFQTQNALNK